MLPDFNSYFTILLRGSYYDIHNTINHTFKSKYSIRPVSYLEACLEKKDLKKSEVIEKTNLQKNYAYQICNGTKKGSKEKIIQLALAMHLDLHDTNNLLSLSNNGLLYAKVKKDAILIYALQHHYDLYQTNELLLAHGFEILD